MIDYYTSARTAKYFTFRVFVRNSPAAPFPHPKPYALRERRAGLFRQDGDLSSVMGIVRNQVGDEPTDVWLEPLDLAVPGERGFEQLSDRLGARGQGLPRLRAREGVALQLFEPLQGTARRFQPHQPHIMDMGHDRGHRPSFLIRRHCRPSLVREVLDQV